MKALNYQVIVEIGTPYEEEIVHGELTLAIDPEFNPTKYSKTVGKVISAGHKTEGLKKDDIVYFHFGAIDINPDVKQIATGVFFVEFKDIFCKKDASKECGLTAVGGWVLCEPTEVPVPEGYSVEDVDGTPMLVSKASGIVAKNHWEKYFTNIMKVVAHPDGLYEGKNVVVPNDCDFDNYGRKISDKKYFYVEKDLIDGLWEA